MTIHSVTVTPSSITLPVGGTAILGVAVDAGAGVTDKSVTWSSSDATVASVDNTGKVTAIKGGVVTIKATANADHATSGAAVVTVQAAGNVVHSVTIVPSTMQLGQGQSGSFAATVNADAGVTNLGVTWSISDTSVATIDQSGNVKASATKAGTVTVRATSKADSTVSGVAALTVVGTAGNTPIVTVSSLTTVNGAGNEVPANTSNVNGQLNVYLNVDANGATLKSVSATLTCGADVVTQTQTIGSNKIGASAAAGQVVFSFNTAAFDSTGKAALHNGSCTVSAQAATAAGTQSATVSTPFTLNNADAVYGSISVAKTATDAAGLAWGGGDVTVKITPVFYTAGRSAVSGTVTLTGAAAGPTATGLGAGSTAAVTTFPATVVFSATKAPGAGGGVKGVTVTGLSATATFVDNLGNTFNAGGALSNAGSLGPTTKLDNQGPSAGTYAFTSQGTNNGWVGAAYVFSSSAGGYTATVPVGETNNDHSGVDKVTVTFAYAPHGTTNWTTVTAASAIPASNVNTAYDLQMTETDALGNSTVTTWGPFGVDLNPPTLTLTGSTAANTVSAAAGGSGTATATVTDDFSGPNNTFMAITRQNSTVTTNGAACILGTATTSASHATDLGAVPTYDPTGAITGYCLPVSVGVGTQTHSVASGAGDGYYTVSSYATDQAGNKTAAQTRSVGEDATAPTQGGVSLPASITGGSTASFSTSSSDNMDAVRNDVLVDYPAMNLYYSNALGGVAFDNVLTGASGISYSINIPNFITSLQQTVANAPPGALGGDVPTGMTVTTVDEAANVSTAQNPSFGAVTLTTGTAYGSASLDPTMATWTAATSHATVSDCPAAGCAPAAANPTSTTLTGVATGPTGTFNIPFTTVTFYYNVGAGTTWYPIGTVSSPAASDNGVTRTWTYSLSWTPPKTTPQNASLTGGAALTVRAVGQDASGNALASAAVAITLTNP